MKRYIAALAVMLSLCSASAQASFVQIIPVTQQYNFSGACSDCNQGVNVSGKPSEAQLVLRGYVAGTAISSGNFVSFHYNGTDLLNEYWITMWDQPAVSGAMLTSLPNPSEFSVASSQYYFSTNLSGAWSTGPTGSNFDQGNGGSFSSAVPEPGSAALLGLGLMGLAGLRRKGAGAR